MLGQGRKPGKVNVRVKPVCSISILFLLCNLFLPVQLIDFLRLALVLRFPFYEIFTSEML